jgi:CRISPR-associated endoribonuclease Cas6
MNDLSHSLQQASPEIAATALTQTPLLPNDGTLHAIVIELSAAQRGVFPTTLGRAIQAQVLAWLSLANPAIAQMIHDSQDNPISLSGLLGHRRSNGDVREGDSFSIRISLLQGSLIHPLLQGIDLWGNKTITLGKCAFVLRGVAAMPGTHAAVGSSSYELLFKTPRSQDDITLQFQSPTSFKQEIGIQPFPLPELVFGGLLRRWNLFAGSDYQIPPIVWRAVVSAAEIKTHALQMESAAEIGSQGWVRYRFPDSSQSQIAAVLAYFSFFAGVGRKTSRGMGQTQLLQKSPIQRKR